MMRPVSDISVEAARRVSVVCTDIDDTLTEGGLLLREAYAALWRLHEAGIGVVPVTGRPAGWCDCIIRQWPIEAVIGENGAFAWYREQGRIRELAHPAVASRDHRRRLNEVRKAVVTSVPGARIARDQPFRRYDLAIDFREDPPDLGFDAARRIAVLCREFGAEAKISSIHVNTWFGDYDKLDMTRRYLMSVKGFDEVALRDEVIFCGDSPNDEPMFGFFPLSCAVGNVRDVLDLITRRPRFVTVHTHGRGFAELVDTLLEKRSVRA